MIAWDDSFSSGIEEVDNQHREIIRLLQRLAILQDKGSSKDFVSRILQELAKYTEYHFTSEENLMLVTKYPALEHHQFEHRKMLRALTYKIQSYEDNNETLGALIAFLCQWLADHTREEDGRIRAYLASRSSNTDG